MKYLQITILVIFGVLTTQGQSIHRSVIGSAGMVSTSGNIRLSSTTGEALIQTLSSANNRITQGFQQSEKSDSTTLYLLLYLEGYYSGGYFMRPALHNQGQSAYLNITDTITVELHPASTPSIVSAQVKTILYTNSNASCMMHVSNGNYYIVIKHRNSIETWSASPVAFMGTYTGYDFTYATNTAYGNNQVEVEPGVFAIYSGDINQDENVDLLDLALLESDINTFRFGYFTTDINGDGNVDLLDAPVVESNINQFVFSNHP